MIKTLPFSEGKQFYLFTCLFLACVFAQNNLSLSSLIHQNIQIGAMKIICLKKKSPTPL